MNTTKLYYGLLAILVLLIAACTPTSTSEEDELYEVGIRRDKIIPPRSTENIRRDKIIPPRNTNSIRRDKIIPPR